MSPPGGARSVAVVLTAALAVASCGEAAPTSEGASQTTQAIVGGKLSPASENAVVLLRNPRGDCTATLVAPNLVVTARHCVSAANRAMTCDERGATLAGGQSGADYEPGKLAVYVGESLARAGALPPSALGRQIVHDGSPTLCDHDLAFVVLDESLTPAPAPLRLAAPPRVGETFRAVGWGLASDPTLPTTRVSRAGVVVRAVGPDRATTAGPRELAATEGACDGDSGSPALAESDGALLGVVTRGGSPRAAKLAPPEACKGDDIVNVYVSLAANVGTAQAAFRAAGQPVPAGPAPGSGPCDDGGSSTACGGGATPAPETSCGVSAPGLPRSRTTGVVALALAATLRLRRRARGSRTRVGAPQGL